METLWIAEVRGTVEGFVCRGTRAGIYLDDRRPAPGAHEEIPRDSRQITICEQSKQRHEERLAQSTTLPSKYLLNTTREITTSEAAKRNHRPGFEIVPLVKVRKGRHSVNVLFQPRHSRSHIKLKVPWMSHPHPTF